VHILGPYDQFPQDPKRGYTAPEAPVAKLRAQMETLGFARVVIVHVTAHGEELRVTLDALRQLRPNARGIAILNLTPLMGDDPNYEDIEALTKRIARLNWHLVLMPASQESFRKLAPRLKDLPVEVVLDHFAWRGWDIADPSGVHQPGFRAVLDALASGRIWVKLAGPSRFGKSPAPNHADVQPYARALVEARPDRLLWGSDWPHVRCWDHPVPDDAALVELLAEWIPDEATRNQVLVDNPARLYGFT
jgi:predicted TIM-barrel fold metal-dependent hydrolase